MKITDIKFKPVSIKLKREFKIAHSTSTEYQGVLLKIETDENLFGLGEASPSKMVTGETAGSVLYVLEHIFKPALIGRDPAHIEKITGDLDKLIFANTSAKAAVDIALHDLLGKKASLPIYQTLGGYKDEMETSITIGIKSIKQTLQEAAEIAEAGVKAIKLKIGLNPAADIEKVKLLRAEVGDDIKIWLDANQGYTVNQAINVIRQLEESDIEFIE